MSSRDRSRARHSKETRPAQRKSRGHTISARAGSEHWLRKLLSTAPQLMFAALDLDHRLVAFNEAYQHEVKAAYGIDIELGADLFEDLEHLPPGERGLEHLWRRAIRGESFTIVREVGLEVGPRSIVEAHFAPVRNSAGHPLGAVFVARDITEEVRSMRALEQLNTELERRVAAAGRALRKREEQLRLAVDAGELGVWDYDPATGKLWWDERCREIFGLVGTGHGAVVDHQTALERLLPGDRAAASAAFERALDPDDPDDSYTIEQRVLLPDGRTAWVAARARVHFNTDADGRREAERMIGIFQDVTERKQIEARLRAGDASKDQFLGMLGHELRNPLSALSTSVELWRRLAPEDEDERLERVRGMIARQTQQLNRLVDDLQDVSRIARGKLTLHLEALDVREPMQRAVEAARQTLDARDVALEVELPDEPLPVIGDADRIEQIVVSLLANAARHTPPGGHVMLDAEHVDGEVRIDVRDDGRGLTPEALESLFDEFHELHAQGPPSLGVGLSLVRRLTELQGGHVEAFSAGKDQGTEIYVHLPACEGAPERELERVQLLSTQRQPRALDILVVDDNQDIANSLAALLEGFGHHTRVAHDGRSALELAHEQPPEVVLLDIRLPDIDGCEVARRIRADATLGHPHLVAMTGLARPLDEAKAAEAGFDDLMLKPIDLEKLLTLLAAQPSQEPPAEAAVH